MRHFRVGRRSRSAGLSTSAGHRLPKWHLDLCLTARLVKDSPAVSMLWESVDPAERLTTRFGFRSAASAADWIADALQSHWGLTVAGCERLVISSWNVMAWFTADGRRLVAK